MLRVTGGELRGRLIHAPKSDRTRPTQSRLRQAAFNSIQGFVQGSRALDLFAGSGALGIEALSRGAQQVTFVEQAKPVAKLIERNLIELGVQDRAAVWAEPVESLARRLQGAPRLDLVFADPPYGKNWENLLLQDFLPWGELLNPEALLLLEWGLKKGQAPELPERVPFLVKIREKIYGESVLTTYQRDTHA